MHSRQLKIVRLISLYFLIICYSNSLTADTSEKLIVWNRTYDQPNMLNVLKLALDHSGQGKQSLPYKLIRSDDMEQGRVMRELQSPHGIDIAAFAPTPEREQQAIPIRIPVSKGLLGFRVCLVRKGEEDLYKNITNIETWKASGYSIGQGTHWPDTAILEANQLKVEKSAHYKPLFEMLNKHRFDCFARGVNEVFSELEQHKDKLSLEKNLVFRYRLPTFFFVNQNRPELASRIEKGLRLAIDNGQFNLLFNQQYGNTLNKIDFKNRTIIKLNNPYLSPKTQRLSQEEKLWLEPLTHYPLMPGLQK